jgi:hypothetical protein
VRFELTTLKSTRFQDERHKPDSTKYPIFIKKENLIFKLKHYKLIKIIHHIFIM